MLAGDRECLGASAKKRHNSFMLVGGGDAYIFKGQEVIMSNQNVVGTSCPDF